MLNEDGIEMGEDIWLQRALADCDPNNFKKFRQTNCFDPVALRVIALDKLSQPASESSKKKPGRLEVT